MNKSTDLTRANTLSLLSQQNKAMSLLRKHCHQVLAMMPNDDARKALVKALDINQAYKAKGCTFHYDGGRTLPLRDLPDNGKQAVAQLLNQ
jgi:hypothetical protein